MNLSVANYESLKTSLRLSIHVIEMLAEKKSKVVNDVKTKITDCIKLGNFNYGKLYVMNIIKEDKFIDGLNMVALYCRLLLARFNTIKQTNFLEESIAEAVCGIIWVAEKIRIDVPEIVNVANFLVLKYGVRFAEAVLTESVRSLSKKLKRNIGMEPPHKHRVDEYLKQIAVASGISYPADCDNDLKLMEMFINEIEKDLSLHTTSPTDSSYILCTNLLTTPNGSLKNDETNDPDLPTSGLNQTSINQNI